MDASRPRLALAWPPDALEPLVATAVPAVELVPERVRHVVVLMVVFGWIEGRCGKYLGLEMSLSALLVRHSRLGPLGQFALSARQREGRRTVLWPLVAKLESCAELPIRFVPDRALISPRHALTFRDRLFLDVCKPADRQWPIRMRGGIYSPNPSYPAAQCRTTAETAHARTLTLPQSARKLRQCGIRFHKCADVSRSTSKPALMPIGQVRSNVAQLSLGCGRSVEAYHWTLTSPGSRLSLGLI